MASSTAPAAAPRRGRRLAIALVVVGVLAVPAAIQTLPPPGHVADRVAPNGGDPLFVTWVLGSEVHAAGHHPSALFAANIFYPRRDAIAWSDSLIAGVPVFAVLEAVTGGRLILAYNLFSWVAFLCVGLAVFALARRVLGDPPAALVTATLVSSSAARSVSVGHTQLAGFVFVALALLALMRFLDERRWLHALAFGAAAGATWLVTAYYAVMLAVVVAVFLLVWVVAARGSVGRRFWSGLGLALGAAAVLVAPTLPPYVRLQRAHFFERTLSDQRGVTWADLIRLPPSPLYRAVTGVAARARYDRGALYPGAVLLGLLIVAAVDRGLSMARARRVSAGRARPGAGSSASRSRVIAIAFGIAAIPCVVLMLGPLGSGAAPLASPFRAMRATVPGVKSLRDLDRFWIYPLLCLALAAGAGARRLLGSGGRRRVGVAALLVLAAWGELLFRPPFVGVDLSGRTTAADHVLAAMPSGAVLELPQPLGSALPYVTTARQLRSLVDGHPRVDGYSGNTPPLTYRAELLASAWDPPHLVAPMRAFGVRYLVLHGTARPCAAGYGPVELAGWVRALDQTPGVVAVVPAGPDVVVELAPAPIDRRLPSVAPAPPRPSACA